MTFSSKANTLVVRQRLVQLRGGVRLWYSSQPAPRAFHRGMARPWSLPAFPRGWLAGRCCQRGQSRRASGQGRQGAELTENEKQHLPGHPPTPPSLYVRSGRGPGGARCSFLSGALREMGGHPHSLTQAVGGPTPWPRHAGPSGSCKVLLRASFLSPVGCTVLLAHPPLSRAWVHVHTSCGGWRPQEPC